MVEGGSRPRFVQQALATLHVVRELGREHLQGEPAVKHGVLGEEDAAHAALAERLGDAR